MKIKEAIEILQKLDPEMEMVTTSSNFETNYAIKSFTGFSSPTKMKEIEESFRDAFDGGTYTMKVWKYDEEGIEVLRIS